ncbi:MAG: PmeII family type II restriction endonuclease [Candidatus Methylumidiphilus sp.]
MSGAWGGVVWIRCHETADLQSLCFHGNLLRFSVNWIVQIMNKSEVIAGVSKQIVWWMGERQKKLAELRHETMSVNPFLLPLVFGIHHFKDFDELAGFLVAAHLSTGYATGFGKLIDEKVLPYVFGTIKLDRATRKAAPFSMPVFDEVDHIIPSASNQTAKLLSLKAGRWTIQLTMAVQLNKAFKELVELRDTEHLGSFTFDEIAVGVFYGTKETLTDKYDILRGINRGANHDVADLTQHVQVYAGREFWAWLNGGEQQTQEWVLEGIIQGFQTAENSLGSLVGLLADFRKEFSQQFQFSIGPDGTIDWASIIKHVNG